MSSAAGQTDQKDLIINYSKFISTNTFENASRIEKIYVYNESILIFPVIKGMDMPTNGIKVEIPKWIGTCKNLKEFYLVGLFISNLDSNILKLESLEKLKFSIHKNSNVEKIISDLAKFEYLKVLDLSDSIIDKKKLAKFEIGLPKVKIIDSGFF
ncbi:hypothetical protein [Pedobacter sp. BMA]|uniref:hypothetical protein n=1 Tax=Pedobacter sp. BMA TaxID=1663685 RepID=UPI00064AC756|nr:hypothetical protein [Pedobacter sp. BMA]KLT64696.1 hypothetical protein AB669_13140 [Pedobacter sp. BMA]